MKKILCLFLCLGICFSVFGCSSKNEPLTNEKINELLIDKGYEFSSDYPFGRIWNKTKKIDATYQGKNKDIYAVTIRNKQDTPLFTDKKGNCGVFSLNGINKKVCHYEDAGKGRDILDDELYRLGITLEQLLEFMEYKFGD